MSRVCVGMPPITSGFAEAQSSKSIAGFRSTTSGPFQQRLDEVLARPRFYATAILFLGAFALLLAVIGIYGVAAHSITQRTHELGVRVALGARPARLRTSLLRQSLMPVLVGMIVGVAGAIGLGSICTT